MTDEKSKTCPFCRKKPINNTASGYHSVDCINEDCLVGPVTDIFDNQQKAISAWNTRPEYDELSAKMMAMAKEIYRLNEKQDELLQDAGKLVDALKIGIYHLSHNEHAQPILREALAAFESKYPTPTEKL